jgi:hypothetical protein
MKYALTLEPRHGHSEDPASYRKDTSPGRPGHRREGHLRVVARAMDVEAGRGYEHPEQTLVPGLADRADSQSDAFDDETPTGVIEAGADTGDARGTRREHRAVTNDASRAAIMSRAELDRWFDDDENTDVTDVSGPPDAIRFMNASFFDSMSVEDPVGSAPHRERPAPEPATTRAGSFIVISYKQESLEPSSAPLAPPAAASASAPLPQARPQAPAPAAPTPRSHAAVRPVDAVPRRQAPATRRRRSISMGFTLAMFLLVCGVLFLHGWDFYVLELDSRIEHPAYDALRPSGSHGYAYGVSGTVLIFLNLLYLARRRLARANLGSMRTWLDLHVFTGVVGAGFIIFHSAFQLRSPLAITTAVGFAVVMVTGFIGRFLYALAPRPDQNLLSAAIARLEGLLPGIGPHVEHVVRAFPIRDVGGSPSLLRALAALPGWRRTARGRRQAIRFVVENAPAMSRMDGERERAVRAAGRKVERAAALEVRGEAAATLLCSWRSLHRFFALLMLMCVIVHVTMALRYGYHWIFST